MMEDSVIIQRPTAAFASSVSSMLPSSDSQMEFNDDDLVPAPVFDVDSLMSVLKRRFNNDKIYTFTGDVLLSVNPYKRIDKLYNMPSTPTTPHIYSIASRALNNLNPDKEQSIIINGESGSGKTEAAKYVIDYLCAEQSTFKRNDLLHTSNILLEAFGNSATTRNDNSSRFGKYIQLMYNNEREMSGAKISIFLLETSRLVSRLRSNNSLERNYHVFYALLNSLTKGQLAALQLFNSSPSSYKYLNSGHSDPVRDTKIWNGLQRGFHEVLNLDKDTQQDVFKTLSLILNLGDIQVHVADKENVCDNTITSQITKRQDALKNVATLLQVDVDHLATTLTSRLSTSARSSVQRVALSQIQAYEVIDGVSKLIYTRLFDWLVAQINNSLNDNVDHAKSMSLGVLDIYGFEILNKNNLEQLCINFANELLQRQFNRTVFEEEQRLYAEEGIEWERITTWVDNQPCIDLIEKSGGVFSIINDQTLMLHHGMGIAAAANYNASIKHIETQLLQKLNKQCGSNPHFRKPRIAGSEFLIRHFAGEVTYNVSSMPKTNMNIVNPEILMLLCQNPFLRTLLNEDLATKSTKFAAKATIASRFRQQLHQLTGSILSQATPYYIRCVSPNQSKSPDVFETDFVRKQLNEIGVMETLRIRRLGYPVRYHQADFLQRYKALIPATTASLEESLQGLVGDVQVGKTLVFLKDNTTQQLDALLRQKQARAATTLQSLSRSYLELERYQSKQRAAAVLQRHLRGQKARNHLCKLHKSAGQIQRVIRQRVAFVAFEREQSAIKIQKYTRGFQSMKLFTRKIVATKRIQAAARAILNNNKLKRQLEDLHQAAATGELDVFKSLYSEENSKILYKGKFLYHVACENSQVGIVDFLRCGDNDVSSVIPYDLVDLSGNNLFHSICAGGSVALLKRAIFTCNGEGLPQHRKRHNCFQLKTPNDDEDIREVVKIKVKNKTKKLNPYSKKLLTVHNEALIMSKKKGKAVVENLSSAGVEVVPTKRNYFELKVDVGDDESTVYCCKTSTQQVMQKFLSAFRAVEGLQLISTDSPPSKALVNWRSALKLMSHQNKDKQLPVDVSTDLEVSTFLSAWTGAISQLSSLYNGTFVSLYVHKLQPTWNGTVRFSLVNDELLEPARDIVSESELVGKIVSFRTPLEQFQSTTNILIELVDENNKVRASAPLLLTESEITINTNKTKAKKGLFSRKVKKMPLLPDTFTFEYSMFHVQE